MHKGREQFWSLLLIAINITVTAAITLAMMDYSEETLQASTDVANTLNCYDDGNTGILRLWFQNLDRYQYIIGDTNEYYSIWN